MKMGLDNRLVIPIAIEQGIPPVDVQSTLLHLEPAGPNLALCQPCRQRLPKAFTQLRMAMTAPVDITQLEADLSDLRVDLSLVDRPNRQQSGEAGSFRGRGAERVDREDLSLGRVRRVVRVQEGVVHNGADLAQRLLVRQVS